MRSDLAKLTTEHERGGSSNKSRKYGGRVRVNPDPEHDYLREYGGFHSSSRYLNHDEKNLTDVLNPLYGNLRKNVGRPWDKVFSEFCQVLDRRSMAGYHIWTHLMQVVETHTFMNQGEVCAKPAGYKFGSSRVAPVNGFYVHPITGILSHAQRIGWKRASRARYTKLERDPDIPVPGTDDWKYRKLNGVWFRSRDMADPRYKDNFYLRAERQKDWKFGYELASCNRKEIAWIEQQLKGRK